MRLPPHRLLRHVLHVMCCGWIVGALLPAIRAAEPEAEYRVKAACVYNFTKFVEWPPSAAPRTGPIVIGVLQSAEFRAELEKIIRGRTVNGRALTIRAFTPDDDVDGGFDVVFVPLAGEQLMDRAALASLHARHVLTVGESPEFARLGGMITFALEDDKVRFHINQREAERAGLKLSAQLLKLATRVDK